MISKKEEDALILNARVTQFIKAKIGPEKMQIFLNVFRDGESLCVLSFNPDRELLKTMLRMVIVGMGADMIVLSWEGAVRTPPHWNSIVSTVYTRAGEIHTIRQSYRLEGDNVRWVDRSRPEEVTSAGINEEVARLWDEPLMEDTLREINAKLAEKEGELGAVDPDLIQAMTEASIYQHLDLVEGVAYDIHATKDSLRARNLARAFEIYGFTREPIDLEGET